MKEIKSILNVLESPYVDKEPLLDNYFEDQKSLISKLTLGISNDEYSSDTEAGRELYGNLFNKHTFEELKSKTRQRALTTLLTVELKPQYQKTREAFHHKLLKTLTQAHLLLSFGARPTGIKLFKRIAHSAKQCSFTDIQLVAVQALRSHYWFVGNRTEYDKLSDYLHQLTHLLEVEQLGEHLFYSTTQSFVNSTAAKSHLSSLFKNALQEYSQLLKVATSYSINVNWFNLRIAYLEHDNKFSDVIRECKRGISYLESKPHYYSHKYYVHFLLAQSGALLQLHDYNELIKLTDALRIAIPPRNPNRIIVERNAFLANLRSFKLGEAQQIVSGAQDTLQVNIQEHVKEEWLLFKGYSDLLLSLDLQREPTNPLKGWIKSSKDKLGTNLSALILDAIYCISSNDVKLLNIIDKKVDNYLYRYLNNATGYKRTISFLKLLRICIREDYNKRRILSKGKTYIQHLDNTSSKLEPVEIMPYHQLAKLLLKYLK